jgi:hypothetical protein
MMCFVLFRKRSLSSSSSSSSDDSSKSIKLHKRKYKKMDEVERLAEIERRRFVIHMLSNLQLNGCLEKQHTLDFFLLVGRELLLKWSLKKL